MRIKDKVSADPDGLVETFLDGFKFEQFFVGAGDVEEDNNDHFDDFSEFSSVFIVSWLFFVLFKPNTIFS